MATRLAACLDSTTKRLRGYAAIAFAPHATWVEPERVDWTGSPADGRALGTAGRQRHPGIGAQRGPPSPSPERSPGPAVAVTSELSTLF